MADLKQIERELPAVGTDLLIVSGGAVLGQVIGNQFKPAPGKTDVKPFVLIVLAILATIVVKNPIVKKLAMGLVVHQILKLVFKDQTIGKSVLAGPPLQRKALGAGETEVLRWYDDSYLLGLGCPDCGGTCGMQPQMLNGLGCCQILGLGSITQYLSPAQLSEIRSMCPGLEERLNSAISQANSTGGTITNVTYNTTTCTGRVNMQSGTASNPNFANPIDPKGTASALNLAVGDLAIFAECTVYANKRNIKVSVKQWNGTQFVDYYPPAGSSAMFRLSSQGQIWINRSFAGERMYVETAIDTAYDLFDVRVIAEGKTISKTFACNLATDLEQSFIDVSVPKTVPPATTAPPTLPPPSNTLTSNDLMVEAKCYSWGLQVKLINRKTGFPVVSGQNGFGNNFGVFLTNPPNNQQKLINQAGVSISHDFNIANSDLGNTVNVAITGNLNGNSFSISNNGVRCVPSTPPPTISSDCEKLVQMGLDPEASKKMDAVSCANVLKQLDPTVLIRRINCTFKDTAKQANLTAITVDGSGQPRFVYPGVMTEINKIYPITEIRSAVNSAGQPSSFTPIVGFPEELAGMWNFGDGQTMEGSTKKTVQHVYNAPGTYNVTFTIQTACGPESKMRTVSVQPAVTVTPPQPPPPPRVSPPPPLQLVSSTNVIPSGNQCTVTVTDPPRSGGGSSTVSDGLPRGWVFNPNVNSGCKTTCIPCATTCKPCITNVCSAYNKRKNPRQSIYKR